jgi:RimJ/RimL family protein N-acetyltransferase
MPDAERQPKSDPPMPHRLRPYRREDRVDFVALLGDPNVMRYVGDGVPLDTAQAAQLFGRMFEVVASDPTFHVWAIEIDGAYAGHAELKRRRGKPDHELIYYLAKPYWGRGYGKRVAAEIVAFGLETCGMPHVIATVDEANVASRHILESLGFREDARIRRDYSPAGVGYVLTGAAFSERQRPDSSVVTDAV